MRWTQGENAYTRWEWPHEVTLQGGREVRMPTQDTSHLEKFFTICFCFLFWVFKSKNQMKSAVSLLPSTLSPKLVQLSKIIP